MIQIENNVFHLFNKNFSYVFFLRDNRLVHAYFGKSLIEYDNDVNFTTINHETYPYFGNDCQRFEIGEFGRGDFRIPSVQVSNGKSLTTDFKFVKYNIINDLEDYKYPHVRDKKETLEVILEDKTQNLELRLYYSVVAEGIIKKAKLINRSDREVIVHTLSSGMLDLPIANYKSIDLNGRWGNECNVSENIVTNGIKTISSTRGVSSHQHNPFLIIGNEDLSDFGGDVYGFSLIYSSNFELKMEMDEKSQLRVIGGFKLLEDGYPLAPNESLTTPELISIFTDKGVNNLSNKFHDLISRQIINKKYTNDKLPIVLNTWESFYFDINEEKMLTFIEKAKDIGFTTIVLDDGWFKNRNDDHTSLGDWVIDKNKFPNGFGKIIDKLKEYNMEFGIWFEPESISPKSDIYKARKDFAIEDETIKGLELRNQLVMDFSKDEVVEYAYTSMKKVLSEYKINYVKWDMNRPLTDTKSTKQYVDSQLGVYRLYELLLNDFPNLIIEGCSSGGGRFDLGILYYSPFIWTSDDTDGYERMKIQYGTSYLYPLRCLSNHVSICPNHQTGRFTPLKTRGNVASFGVMGYELNLDKLTSEELEIIKKQIRDYKEDKDLILDGTLYRLFNPFKSNNYAMEVVSSDKTKAIAVFANILVRPNMPLPRIKFKGLDPNKNYFIKELNITVNGNILMNLGLHIELEMVDFNAITLHLESKNEN